MSAYPASNAQIAGSAIDADAGSGRSIATITMLWLVALAGAVALLVPGVALAGPFATGAAAAQTSILAILTPIAVIAVMVLGAAAWFNRISWGWCVAGVCGIVLVFGAPQIVAWVRGMFGV